jgi:hypothetical protein
MPTETPAPVANVAKPVAKPGGPVSVFVSRKEGKLFVRQNFRPLFEAPVTIQHPELALGTHVLTAMETKDDGAAFRWTVVSIPSDYPRVSAPPKKSSRAEREKLSKPVPAVQLLPAAEALSRVELPKEAADRISGMLSPGFSFIISDNGISDETGTDTDFVVLTR